MVRANTSKADFKHNYQNACQYEDTGLRHELVMNEIASLINEKPLTIIQALDKSGYVFNGTTKAQLSEAIFIVMGESPEFATMIATLIAMNTGQVSYEEIASHGSLNDTGRREINARYFHVVGPIVNDVMQSVAPAAPQKTQYYQDPKKEFILDQLTSLVINKPLTLIQAMTKAGYEFKGSTTQDLIDAVAEVMHESSQFAGMLAGLIVLNSGVVSYEEIVQMAEKEPIKGPMLNSVGSSIGSGADSGGGGMDIISAALDAFGGITSASLQLAAVTKEVKGQESVADTQLQTAKISADASVNVANADVKKAMLGAIQTKLAGASSSMGGSSMLLYGLLLIAALIIGGVILKNKGGSAQTMPPPPVVINK